MRRLLLLLALSFVAPTLGTAQPLGRLFFTPAERRQLDTVRTEKGRPSGTANQVSPASSPDVLTFDGWVRRSDGKTTVWINGRAINDEKVPDGLPITGRIRPDGSVRVGTSQADRPLDIKVGQSVDMALGAITEPYGRPSGLRESSGARAPSEPVSGAAAPVPAAPLLPRKRKDVIDTSPDRR